MSELLKPKNLGEYTMFKPAIGTGSFAEVYRGHRNKDKKLCAIKVIKRSKVEGKGNEKIQDSLEFEISLLQRPDIDFSYIVELYDVRVRFILLIHYHAC